jgi:hypothetical protein
MAQIAVSTKSIQEKLQMKPGRSVLVVNQPAEYAKLLGKIPTSITVAERNSKNIDVIQVFVESRQQLEDELPKMKKALATKGMIWVTYPKGTSSKRSDINRDSISEYSESIGLEGVAIISINGDWSALRLKVVS